MNETNIYKISYHYDSDVYLSNASTMDRLLPRSNMHARKRPLTALNGDIRRS